MATHLFVSTRIGVFVMAGLLIPMGTHFDFAYASKNPKVRQEATATPDKKPGTAANLDKTLAERLFNQALADFLEIQSPKDNIIKSKKTGGLPVRINWLEKFKQLEAGKLLEVDSQTLELLLTLRVRSQRLRSAFYFFDVNPNVVRDIEDDGSKGPPKDYDRYVVHLGRLKDLLVALQKKQTGSSSKSSSDGHSTITLDPLDPTFVKIRERAGKLVRRLEDGSLQNSLQAFQPANTEQIKKFMRDIFERSVELLSLSVEMRNVLQEPQLTAKKYHELRKAIRDYVGLVEFLRYDADSVHLKDLEKVLSAPNQKMGKTHDELVQQLELALGNQNIKVGKTAIYQNTYLKVPKKAFEAVRAIETFFGPALGIKSGRIPALPEPPAFTLPKVQEAYFQKIQEEIPKILKWHSPSDSQTDELAGGKLVSKIYLEANQILSEAAMNSGRIAPHIYVQIEQYQALNTRLNQLGRLVRYLANAWNDPELASLAAQYKTASESMDNLLAQFEANKKARKAPERALMLVPRSAVQFLSDFATLFSVALKISKSQFPVEVERAQGADKIRILPKGAEACRTWLS